MKNKTNIILLLAAPLLLGTLNSCGGGEGSSKEPTSSIPSSASYLTLDQTEKTVDEDGFFILRASTNVEGTIKWTTDDESTAIVNSSGRVIGIAAGTTSIKASIGNLSASCTVTVNSTAGKKTPYIKLECADFKIGLNETTKRYVDAELINAPFTTFTYSSTDESIVKVDASGKITPVAVGQASILIKAGDVESVAGVSVYKINKKISSIKEWNEMLITYGEPHARFYLDRDLDFNGVPYKVINYGNILLGEIDGCKHTVSNVTFASNSSRQSLFGFTSGITVKNFVFENITFSSTMEQGNCGFFVNVMKHFESVVYDTNVTNVSCDFRYTTSVGSAGFCRSFYGGVISQSFINMRGEGITLSKEKDAAMFWETYLWYSPNAISNVIVNVQNGSASTEWSTQSMSLSHDGLYYFESLIEADAKANELFPSSIWSTEPNEIPTLK